MNNDSTVVVRPAKNIQGSVRLPGDKSISHRYAMLAAIAEGDTKLENYSTGADCASTLGCIKALGANWERDGDKLVIHGRGRQLQCPNRAARLRKLRFHGAHVERDSCWAELYI